MHKKCVKRYYKKFTNRGAYNQRTKFLRFQKFKTRIKLNFKKPKAPPKNGGIKFKKTTVFKRNLKTTPLGLSKRNATSLIKESLKQSLLYDDAKTFKKKYNQFQKFKAGKLSSNKVSQLIQSNSNLFIKNDSIEIVEKNKIGVYNKSFKNKTIDKFSDFLNKKEIKELKIKNKNALKILNKLNKSMGTMSSEMHDRFREFLDIAANDGGFENFAAHYPDDFDRLSMWCGINPEELREIIGVNN